MHFLIVLEAKSLKSRNQWGHRTFEVSRGNHSWALPAPGAITPISASVVTLPPPVLCMSVSLRVSLTRMLVIGLRVHLDNLRRPHLRALPQLHLQRSFFRIRQHNRFQGLEHGHTFLGATIQLTKTSFHSSAVLACLIVSTKNTSKDIQKRSMCAVLLP